MVPGLYASTLMFRRILHPALSAAMSSNSLTCRATITDASVSVKEDAKRSYFVDDEGAEEMQTGGMVPMA